VEALLVNSQEALDLIEQILPPGTLTPIKVLVFHQSWNDKEYRAIAREAGYDNSYIREVGAELWRSLSEVLKEPVKKKNFRSLLKQKFEHLRTGQCSLYPLAKHSTGLKGIHSQNNCHFS